jgi:hypothetical protein
MAAISRTLRTFENIISVNSCANPTSNCEQESSTSAG